jgi:hypothetical protein
MAETTMENSSRNLQLFGLELDMDLRTPLDERAQAQFKALFYREKLLVFSIAKSCWFSEISI